MPQGAGTLSSEDQPHPVSTGGCRHLLGIEGGCPDLGPCSLPPGAVRGAPPAARGGVSWFKASRIQGETVLSKLEVGGRGLMFLSVHCRPGLRPRGGNAPARLMSLARLFQHPWGGRGLWADRPSTEVAERPHPGRAFWSWADGQEGRGRLPCVGLRGRLWPLGSLLSPGKSLEVTLLPRCPSLSPRTRAHPHAPD